LPRAHIELDKRAVIAPVRELGSTTVRYLIAPIMTEPGGPAWRQTTFFPFAIMSRLASGEVIRPVIEGPTYGTARHGEAPVIDAVATVDYAKNALADQERVKPAANASAALTDGVLTIELPPVSWTAAALC